MLVNNKTLTFPLYIIGLSMIICGIRWLIHPEPWMLDEVANVERLGMTFQDLFNEEINSTLPDYLTQIYRFFGFWVLVIGFFITSPSSRNPIINVMKIINWSKATSTDFLKYKLVSYSLNLQAT